MTSIPSARQILDALVSFPTVSHDTNIPLIDWAEAYLTQIGLTSHRLVKEDEPTKHALFASVGPDVPGGIVLSGHTDVVPVEGQPWSTDPWEVVEKDGKLFGRGTCDMKGFDALALNALRKARTAPLKRPLQIALSFDEEIGCAGAPPLIAAMENAGLPKAAMAIIGEPSMMKCVTAHKGSSGFDVHVKGYEVHSSLLDRGVSAIMEAARLVEWANARNDENRAKVPSELAAIFDPPWTTLHVGKIRGGTAHNITAKDCRFDLEFRVVPDEDVNDWIEAVRAVAAEIEKRMQSVHPATGIDLEPYFGVPGLRPEQDGAAEALVRRITGDNGTHVVSYGTEAGHFQNAGISSVICGPGDIAQAHQADEWLSIEQFEAGEAFLDRIIDSLCD
ncbi:acetylornithine deacetylase [Silicimonas sp. MF1-12-2]|uniref:acetylornithine deacetylase n=1 Tax=Silicimonas sp. MF1-12-2 TaxID=3384793 RepID=UPI0039B65C15